MTEKSKSGKSLVCRHKRHRQNVRTFMSVTKRRQKHVDAHRGLTMDQLGARTWLTPPTSKAAGKLLT